MTTPQNEENTPTLPAKESQLKPYYERSFELEMLISGAVLYFLFNLPQSVNDFFEQWRNQTNSTGETGALLVGTALIKSVALILQIGLTAHLLLRCFWVGIVGLDSVYPLGVRPEKARGGNIAKEYMSKQKTTLSDLGQSIDSISRLMYSIAFSIMIMLFATSIFTSVLVIMGYLLHTYFFPFLTTLDLFFIVFGVVYIPMLLAFVLDYISTKWRIFQFLQNSFWFRKIIYGIYGFARTFTLQKIISPILNTFATNVPHLRFQVYIFAITASFLLIFYFEIGVVRYNTFSMIPKDAKDNELHASYYDNLHDTEQNLPVPSIQADMIHDPYLRLFLPYQQSFADSVSALFPSFKPYRRPGLSFISNERDIPKAKLDSAITILAAFYKIYLNDSLLSKPTFLLYHHPLKNIPGLQTYIDVRHLRTGQHKLRIETLHVERKQEYFVPFYK